jgi:hypothetical protein
MTNVRKRKNYILSITNGIETATTQVEKQRLTFEHFQNHLGSYAQRKHDLNFEALGRQPQQLLHLDAPFTEQEVAATIKAMPKEKGPDPDGFIGAFFSSCWEIIKAEIMQTVKHFYNMIQQGFHFLNQALVVLIPKKPKAERLTDFRPISLIYSFGKIISMLLANRLALEHGKLISYN